MKNNLQKTMVLAVLSLGNLVSISTVSADDGELSPLTVVGGNDRAFDLVGSSAYLDTEDIRQQNYTNINRLLAKVPGVYTREEDGFGLFPNLSIRGNLGTRSEKTTIMEDGILMAPAPYSAPGAYYSPNAGRMSAFEILKGSSQVKYGPHTTGGVINYVSTPIPEQESFYGRFTYGSDNTFLGHSHYGNTVETENGRFGYLLELYYQRSDGFRSIQGHGGLGTGFERIEPMLKMFWEPDTPLKQRFEFKFGFTDFDADESYLGLSESDVRRNPYDRYAATMFDNIDTFQYRTYLKYTAEPSDDFKLEATAYFNRFNRNWYKLSKINGGSLHTALLSPASVNSLRGLTPGDIIDVKANNRDYYSYGAQFAGTYDFTTGNVDHSLTAGLRLHKARVRRYQWGDKYSSSGAGDFALSTSGTPGSDANRRQETVATSLFVEDEIKAGKWTLRPGLRLEHLEFDYEDYKGNTFRNGDLTTWAGGMGFTYELCDTDRIFGGIFRGISTPGPKGYTDPDPGSQTDEETSISYELGWRHADSSKHRSFELVGFFTDFDNLLAPATGTT
ncbi:MAG: TonB-dependent receptor plug domain-containing protein, partial [Verrucomicrobiae bacterium]|nr:TonB-dependent receptor plug domain-containing protein [Verrucomicrobiae bacterium]NNJ86195.1 TonB-dependent receptor plug domain-containing protein [Akkermansiaceae bacterium]